MKRSMLIAAAYAAVCIIWGTSWAVVRVNLTSMPPLMSAGIRFGLAALILLPVTVRKGTLLSADRSLFKLAAAVGITAFTLPFALIYRGQMKIDSGLSSVLFATFPFWTVLLSRLRGSSARLTGPVIGGIMLGFIGVAIILRFDPARGYDPAGCLLVLGGTALQAASLLIVQKYGKTYTSASINFWSMAMSAFMLIVASALRESWTARSFDVPSVVSLIYLSLFGTVIVYVMYFWLAQRISAVVLSQTAFVTPLIAVAAGMLWLHERLSFHAALGAVFILAGMVMTHQKEFTRRTA